MLGEEDGGAEGGGEGGGEGSSDLGLSTALASVDGAPLGIGGGGGFDGPYTYNRRDGFDIHLPLSAASVGGGGEPHGGFLGSVSADESGEGMAVVVSAGGDARRPHAGGLRPPPHGLAGWSLPAAPLLPLLPYVTNLHPIRLPRHRGLPAPGDSLDDPSGGGGVGGVGHGGGALGHAHSLSSVDGAPSPWGDSNEFKLLSDASFEDMASALRRRVASWAAKNRLAFALLVCALSSLLFLGGSRGLGAWRRRRQRKAMAAETAAAAEAFLARPDSPEAINAFTAALAQPLGSVGAATVNPEAIRRLSVALAADGSDLPSILRDGPTSLPPRRLERKRRLGRARQRQQRAGRHRRHGRHGRHGQQPGGRRRVWRCGVAHLRRDVQCRLGRRTLGHGHAGARRNPRGDADPRSRRAPLALTSRYATEFLQGVRLGKGGFGRVYRAKHLLDGAEYAVKKVLLCGLESRAGAGGA